MKAALCDISSSFADAVQLNACAIHKALWLAKDLGLHCVLVEGECRDLLDFLKSSEPCMTPYGNLVDDIPWTLFSDIQFSTIPHSCNMSGYMLAQ